MLTRREKLLSKIWKDQFLVRVLNSPCLLSVLVWIFHPRQIVITCLLYSTCKAANNWAEHETVHELWFYIWVHGSDWRILKYGEIRFEWYPELPVTPSKWFNPFPVEIEPPTLGRHGCFTSNLYCHQTCRTEGSLQPKDKCEKHFQYSKGKDDNSDQSKASDYESESGPMLLNLNISIWLIRLLIYVSLKRLQCLIQFWALN